MTFKYNILPKRRCFISDCTVGSATLRLSNIHKPPSPPYGCHGAHINDATFNFTCTLNYSTFSDLLSLISSAELHMAGWVSGCEVCILGYDDNFTWHLLGIKLPSLRLDLPVLPLLVCHSVGPDNAIKHSYREIFPSVINEHRGLNVLTLDMIRLQREYLVDCFKFKTDTIICSDKFHYIDGTTRSYIALNVKDSEIICSGIRGVHLSVCSWK